MIQRTVLMLVAMLFLVPVASQAHSDYNGLLDVRIISDNHGEFNQYRTYPRVGSEGRYFYLEATRGARYSISISNKSDRRIGVVVAVDGRNIINGQKSDLKSSEQMYIIAPHMTNTFEGWRTGVDRTNRFYFTDQADSYAQKVFSDASAMGTVAVAAYNEVPPPVQMKREGKLGTAEAPSPSARSLDRMEAEKSKQQAGTGFGETTYSPSRIVSFQPEYTAAERVVLKYEWSEELCRKGLGRCGRPQNRFWPERPEFAPIPRDFKG